jgi:RNA-directed DNA polymerase
MFDLPEVIEKYSNSYKYCSLSLNKEKTIFRSKKNNRRITGITLANDNSLSIGRYNKRIIRSMFHYYINGRLVENDFPKLHGYLSFIKDVEPFFYDKLLSKYGHKWLEKLKSDVNVFYEKKH